MSVVEHFPKTPRTLVHDALERREGHAVAAHLMRLYERPLCVYFNATSFRGLGDARDVIAGFFADRFSRPDWLQAWREACEKSEMPLRRWLLTSLNFYLHEQSRRNTRDRRTQGNGGSTAFVGERAAEPAAASPSAEQAFERESARSIVAAALQTTRVECEAAGQSTHFEVFVSHLVDGQPYDSIGAARGLSTSQCAGLVRTASAKFRAAIGETLLDEGADPTTLDDEIARLIGALRA